MRSNEELAAIAKTDKNAMAELWQQNRGLVLKLIRPYLCFCNRGGIDEDDLMQCGFIALSKAVNYFDAAKGFKFTSYLQRNIQNVVREALGFKSGRTVAPPFVQSLDEVLPGSEDESLTLGDIIPDESAQEEFEQVQDDWQQAQLNSCFDECLSELPIRHALVLKGRYHEDKTLREVADDLSISYQRVRQLESDALRKLRKPQFKDRLRPFLYHDDLQGTGLTAYKNRGFVSKVELLAGTA